MKRDLAELLEECGEPTETVTIPAEYLTVEPGSLSYAEREREARKEYMREWFRERYATDPEFREKEKTRWRERYATDPEYREKEKTRWREQRAGPEYHEKHNAYQREWIRERRATDPEWREKEKARDRERYVRKKAEKLARQVQEKQTADCSATTEERSCNRQT